MNPTALVPSKDGLAAESELGRTLTNVARFDAIENRINGVEKTLRAQIIDESAHRLKLADEQRGYVDALNRDERAARVAGDAAGRIEFLEFRDRPFWQRLRWLFLGR